MKLRVRNKSFKMIFEYNPFKKGDILVSHDGIEVKVVKTYPFNLWRQVLCWLGLPYTKSNVVKVESIEHENNS